MTTAVSPPTTAAMPTPTSPSHGPPPPPPSKPKPPLPQSLTRKPAEETITKPSTAAATAAAPTPPTVVVATSNAAPKKVVVVSSQWNPQSPSPQQQTISNETASPPTTNDRRKRGSTASKLKLYQTTASTPTDGGVGGGGGLLNLSSVVSSTADTTSTKGMEEGAQPQERRREGGDEEEGAAQPPPRKVSASGKSMTETWLSRNSQQPSNAAAASSSPPSGSSSSSSSPSKCTWNASKPINSKRKSGVVILSSTPPPSTSSLMLQQHIRSQSQQQQPSPNEEQLSPKMKHTPPQQPLPPPPAVTRRPSQVLMLSASSPKPIESKQQQQQQQQTIDPLPSPSSWRLTQANRKSLSTGLLGQSRSRGVLPLDESDQQQQQQLTVLEDKQPSPSPQPQRDAEWERAFQWMESLHLSSSKEVETTESMSKKKAIGNCPRWIPDESSQVCKMCNKPFTFLFRRHHCRKCGELTCNDCTAWRLRLPEIDGGKPVRVCARCYCQQREEDEQQKKLTELSPPPVPIAQTTTTTTPPPPQATSQQTVPETAEGKQERQRQGIIREIIKTEKDYVDDLRILSEVFLLPIKLTGVLSAAEISEVFSNCEMFASIHEELLSKLTAGTGEGQCVGEAFKQMCQYLKMYTMYCSNHEHAVEVLTRLKERDEVVRALNVARSDKRSRGLDIGSYLIKPVQRLCKYPLFFRDLLKNTPCTHPDFKLLEEARDSVDSVVKYINEGKRMMEEQAHIVEIHSKIQGVWEEELVTPTRRLIYEVALQGRSYPHNSMHDYYLYAFTDLLVVTKPLHKITGEGMYKLKGEIPIAQCRLVNVADSETEKNMFELYKNAPGAGKNDAPLIRFQLFAKDESEKKEIIKMIRLMINTTLKKWVHNKSKTTLSYPSSSSSISTVVDSTSTATVVASTSTSTAAASTSAAVEDVTSEPSPK